MASVTLNAAFGEDAFHDVLGNFEIEFVGGGDVAGVVDGPCILRPNMRFTVSSIPVGSTITSISLQVEVLASSGAGSDSWYVGPYGGDGLGDPEADNETVAYNRSNVSGDNYLTTTALRTTGTKVLDITSTASKADLSAALSGGTFSLAIQMVDEASAPVRSAEIWSYDSADPPKLTVVYTAPVAASSDNPSYWRWRV